MAAKAQKARPGHMSGRAQSADKAHKRKNRSDKIKIQQRFLLPASAAPASCGHLRPCKLPWMQVQLPWGGFAEPLGIVKSSRLRRQILPLAKFPCLRAFSTLCQSVDFVNILSAPRPWVGARSGLAAQNIFSYSLQSGQAMGSSSSILVKRRLFSRK